MGDTIKLKDNEVLIFTDFNNTLVDYATEFDYRSELFDDFEGFLRNIKNGVTRCLKKFETETGLVPVICVITNASLSAIDANGYNGICHDLKMTFFNHEGLDQTRLDYEMNSTCEKYIKYLIHKENDGYIIINPRGKNMNDMFIMREFSDDALNIKRSSVKQESAERLINDIGPIKTKVAIFAGDSIVDDYPMKYAITDSGISKIYIRPGKVTKMKASVMQQFCRAKGIEFDCVNPKNNKKIKIFDENSLRFLTEEQQKQLSEYSDGDTILLTNPNSRGFVEGIYQSIDIIKAAGLSAKEKSKDE